MYGFTLGRRLQNAGRGRTVLRLVEALAETFAGLLNLLCDLLVLLGDPLLDKHVGAVTLLRILVVDQGVVEGGHVSRCLPRLGVHEDGGVDAHDILVEFDHRVPPVTLDIVLELHAVLSIVIYGAKAVVYFARREYESVLLAVSHQFLKQLLLCHGISFLYLCSAYVCFRLQKYKINDKMNIRGANSLGFLRRRVCFCLPVTQFADY